MKVGFNSSKAVSTATLGAGAVGGMLVSKLGMSKAPAIMRTPAFRIGVGIVAFLGASSISGTGAAVDGSRGLLIGAGTQQVAEGVAAFLKGSSNPLVSAATEGLGYADSVYNLPANAWDDSEAQSWDAVQPSIEATSGFAVV